MASDGSSPTQPLSQSPSQHLAQLLGARLPCTISLRDRGVLGFTWWVVWARLLIVESRKDWPLAPQAPRCVSSQHSPAVLLGRVVRVQHLGPDSGILWAAPDAQLIPTHVPASPLGTTVSLKSHGHSVGSNCFLFEKVLAYESRIQYNSIRYVSKYFLLGSFERTSHQLFFSIWFLLNIVL